MSGFCPNTGIQTPIKVAISSIVPPGCVVKMREGQGNPFNVWYSTDVYVKTSRTAKRFHWFVSIIVPMRFNEQQERNWLLWGESPGDVMKQAETPIDQLDPDPWSQLAMLTNDEMQRAIEAKLPCCVQGHAKPGCCDCPELRALLFAHTEVKP